MRRSSRSCWAWGLMGMLAASGQAVAQVPNSPATGGGAALGGFGNPIPPGASPYTTPYANPFANPYASPYLNPYWAMNTDPNSAALMYMLASQRAGNGIGSGRLGGPRAAETFGPRPAPGLDNAPAIEPQPRATSRPYFQRPLARSDRGTRYFQRSYRRR